MSGRAEFWRSLLVLGRVSNLPTVWSNCLAAWLIAGGGSIGRFLSLCAGGTLLYLGGMYLNDVIDAEFDRQHRNERPIPAGWIKRSTALWITLVLLVSGTVLLLQLGGVVVPTLLLLCSIVLYDVIHKWVAFSPVIMAACRFWLFLVAAAAAENGITGLAVWAAVALAAYIVGLSYIARRESLSSAINAWPCYFMAVPLLLSFLVNDGSLRATGLLLSLVLAGWVGYCLSHTFWSGRRNVSRTVSGLLAGIVLVDLLAVAGGGAVTTLAFCGLFILALLFQRYVPAT